MTFWGNLGAAICMGIAAIGSAIGIGIAGQGAIGAWKRCYINNKPAPFILTVFAGAPLTQTIYGFLLMNIAMKPVNFHRLIFVLFFPSHPDKLFLSCILMRSLRIPLRTKQQIHKDLLP